MSNKLRWDTSLKLECHVKVFYSHEMSSQTGPQGTQVREQVRGEGDRRHEQDEHRHQQREGDVNLEDQLSRDRQVLLNCSRDGPQVRKVMLIIPDKSYSEHVYF